MSVCVCVREREGLNIHLSNPGCTEGTFFTLCLVITHSGVVFLI